MLNRSLLPVVYHVESPIQLDLEEATFSIPTKIQIHPFILKADICDVVVCLMSDVPSIFPD